MQLNRIVEQELRRAKLPAIGSSPECEETVNRAKAREEELFKKSNSRGVYVNLCVRSLAQTDTAAAAARAKQQEVEVDHSDAIQTALVATGLVESPPASPSRGEEHDRTPAPAPTTTDPKTAAAPVQDPTNHLKDSSAEKWFDNVLEMGNVDNIYGDLEFNLSNDLDDTILSKSLPSVKAEAPPAVPVSASAVKKMTVILSTTPNAAPEPAKALPVTPLAAPQPKEMTQDSAPQVDPLQVYFLLITLPHAFGYGSTYNFCFSHLEVTVLTFYTGRNLPTRC